MRRRVSALLVALLAGAACAAPRVPPPPASEEAIRQKIGSLGVVDARLDYWEQPANWLWVRRAQAWPLLVAALDEPEPRVAGGALGLLDMFPPRPQVRDRLVQIVALPGHPLRPRAAVSLCRYRGEAAVSEALARALRDGLSLAEPLELARVAAIAGCRRREAAEALLPLLQAHGSWEQRRALELLGELADLAAETALTRLAHGSSWDSAALALLALARVDPDHHRLTPSQQLFLQLTSDGPGKWSAAHAAAREQRLAALPPAAARGFLRHMLRSDAAAEAVRLIRLRGDQALVPTLWDHLGAAPSSFQVEETVAAILTVDQREAAVARLLALAQGLDGSRREALARGLVRSGLPPAARLAALRRLAREVDPLLAARGLQGAAEAAALAEPLMAASADPAVLAAYCSALPAGAAPPLQAQVARSLHLAAALPDGTPGGERQRLLMTVLEACARLSVPDSGAVATLCLASPSAPLRLRAARVAAALGGDRQRALRVLETSSLESDDPAVRHLAQRYLRELPCLNEAEGQAREELLLSRLHGDRAAETITLLATCLGSRSVDPLLRHLDAPELGQALSAAWVLAQWRERAVAERALRRLSLAALFWQSFDQQGRADPVSLPGGVSVEVYAPGGRARIRPAPVAVPGRQGLFGPSGLPEQLEAAEQDFAVRVYRAALAARGWAPLPRGYPDATYVPLLETIAAEDPGVGVWEVQQRRIACFPARQQAAGEIARLTGAPAAYPGLEGELLDSAFVRPEAYPEQNRLLARFLVSGMQRVLQPSAPGDGSGELWGRLWAPVESAERLFPDLRAAVDDEILRQGLAPRLEAGHLRRYGRFGAR